MPTIKQKLLLHVCCIGCGAQVAKELEKNYAVSLYFCNPNIFPKEEYDKRLEETIMIAKQFDLELFIAEYDHHHWWEIIKGYESEPERGKRCQLCYELRLKETANFAQKEQIKYFASTLSVSPHKDIKLINQAGQAMAKKFDREFVAEDFKKNDGFKKACQLAKDLHLYRQDYCGCEFSIRK